jgi:hypothetical protein
MIANNQNRKKKVFRTSTKHGTAPASTSRHTKSRRKPDYQSGLEILRQMIVVGELGLYKLPSLRKAGGRSANSRME